MIFKFVSFVLTLVLSIFSMLLFLEIEFSQSNKHLKFINNEIYVVNRSTYSIGCKVDHSAQRKKKKN